MADQPISDAKPSCKVCGSDNFRPSGKCRPCHAAKMRKWIDGNREKKRAADRCRWERDKQAINAKRRGARNKVQNAAARERKRAWYLANRERALEESKARRAERKAADPQGFRAKVAERARRKRATDPRRRVHEKMSRLVAKTLKRHRTSKQGRSWPGLVGYGIMELEARLMATMPAGYTWADYLVGRLEIDHIIPASVFNFASPDDLDFKRCWALSNLRLLTKEENYEKRAKLSAPFQPALPLAIARGAVV